MLNSPPLYSDTFRTFFLFLNGSLWSRGIFSSSANGGDFGVIDCGLTGLGIVLGVAEFAELFEEERCESAKAIVL
jgi:hypothetical protein